MKLISVYERPDRCALLWRLLQERPQNSSISHKSMPLWLDHVKFVERKPYEAWYFIDREPEGSCYLTHNDEIGVFISDEFRRRGIGPWAVRELMAKHGKRRYLANIAPSNEHSIEMFKALDFNCIQYTFEHTE